jgi:hypothetical protein
MLYAVGESTRLYVLNTTTGAATQVGTGMFEVPSWVRDDDRLQPRRRRPARGHHRRPKPAH